jgi:hypothetical protein
MLIFKTAKVSQTAFFKSTYKDLGCVDQAIRQLNGPSSLIFCADQGKRVRRDQAVQSPTYELSLLHEIVVFAIYSERDFIVHDRDQVDRVYDVIHLPGDGDATPEEVAVALFKRRAPLSFFKRCAPMSRIVRTPLPHPDVGAPCEYWRILTGRTLRIGKRGGRREGGVGARRDYVGCEAMQVHPGAHRDDENHDGRRRPCECRDRGSGAEAAEAPSDSEERATHDKASVDVAPFGNFEGRRQQQRRPFRGHAENDGVDGDRADYHEGEARIPISSKIEEAHDFGWLRHPGDSQSEREDHTR